METTSECRIRYSPLTLVDDRVRAWSIVGREEQGTSSYKAELAASLMLLRRVQVDADVAVLVDCKIEMTEIGKWLGEGSRGTWAGAAKGDLPQTDH